MALVPICVYLRSLILHLSAFTPHHSTPPPGETTFPSAPRDRRGPMCEANFLTPSRVLLRLCHGHLFSTAAPAPGVSPAFNTP